MDEKTKYTVIELLDGWKKLLVVSKKKSLRNAKKLRDGSKTIVKEVSSKPITFDYDSLSKQKMVQKKLSEMFPNLLPLITSTPNLDGEWTSIDYIDLYFSHYYLVISKLKAIIKEGNDE